MGKTLTPIFSLAVVMALALAAVFGSMILANPAWAQTAEDPLTVPAAEPDVCESQGFIPNQGVALNDTETYDVDLCFDSGSSGLAQDARSNNEDIATVVVTDGTGAYLIDGSNADDGLVVVTGVAVGETTIDIVSASGQKTMMVAVYDSGPTLGDAIPTQSLSATTLSESVTIDLTDHFDGEDLSYAASTSDNTAVDPTSPIDDGMLILTPASTAIDGDSAVITVTATNPLDETGVMHTFTAYVDGPPSWVGAGMVDATANSAISGNGVAEGTPWVINVLEVAAGDSEDIDLLELFSGSRITYEVESTDEMAATVGEPTATGLVTVTGVAIGSANINITATRGGEEIFARVPVRVVRAAVVIPPTPLMPAYPTFEADDLEPGKNSWYTLNFNINKVFNGGADTMTIKLEEFGVPSSISTSGIAIVATEPASGSSFDQDPDNRGYNNQEEITFNPASISVDGKEITMTFPDVRPEGDVTKKSFDMGTNFKLIIYQSSGISNPTRSNRYGGTEKVAHDDRQIFVSFSGSNVPDTVFLTRTADGGEDQSMITEGVLVPRVVILSEEDGGLGDMVMVEGLGFENGGTLHFFVDKYIGNTVDARGMRKYGQDGILNSGEDVLCSVLNVSGNAGSCEFEVTTPTFSGTSYVNAVDGDGKTVTAPRGGDNEFTLKASISVTPDSGSPGEIIQVQLSSFPNGAAISSIKLSGRDICGGSMPSCVSEGYGSVGSQGSTSIGVTVPNWATAGVQELFVAAGGDDDNTKVIIEGPRIVPTPQTVVANQRVSLIGTGFSPRSNIGRVVAGQVQIARISIGGDDINWSRVNNGRVVEIDDGGNWSASVDLPLSEATTGGGERLIRITDSMGRTGSVQVTLAERDFDVTPPEGRVGTLAVVRGVGYPSKNDEGSSFTIDVVYNVQEGASTRVSVVPDASGRFEVQLRIPTTAAIPSTNQVEVKYRLDPDGKGAEVLDSKQHVVPEGSINLSETSGGPGSTVTISGEGYKAFVNVDSVKIGTFDITPAPKPHTDGNGMMEFDILVPGIDVGIQTIEVQVGGTTASTGFTVTESGVNPGDIKVVAEGVESLGDNLDVIWHFNNDTKEWSFYDGMEGGTLTHVIAGETYLILVKANAEVILNGDTRTLTCVGGNCWNQIVW